jgi:hypothetical protein
MSTRRKKKSKKRRAKAKRFLTRTGQPVDIDAVRKSMEARNRQFQGIGRFMFEFSQLEFAIRAVLVSRLDLKEEYFNIVTGPYDFAKLCTVTREASVLKYPEKKEELEKLFGACLKLNETRVLVAHGLWLDDLDGLSLRIVSRGTFKTHIYSFKKDELARHADKAQELMQRVIGFQGKK